MENFTKNNALKTSGANSTLVLTTQNARVDGAMANAYTLVVSRDNNLYVVGDISREVECLETPETNNYQNNSANGRTKVE